jgi:hypothetical protein
MDEARSEEATQSDQQQECILSGGVYLRHRLKDKQLPFLSETLYHKNERRARNCPSIRLDRIKQFMRYFV